MTRRWIWLCGFVVGAAAAVSASLQTYVSMTTHGHAFAPILLWELGCWWFWAAVPPLLVAQGARFADPSAVRRREWRRTGVLAAVLIAAHIGVDAVAVVLVQPFVPVTHFNFPCARATAP